MYSRMNEKDRQEVIRELLSRIQYGVVFEVNENVEGWKESNIPVESTENGVGNISGCNMEALLGAFERGDIDIRLYLRPMDDMADMWMNQMRDIVEYDNAHGGGREMTDLFLPKLTEFIFGNHYDTNDMIGRGLALPAKEGMYSIKQ